MQPVLPRTTVLGPAAFASSFMICAGWQPLHVRWPDLKYSSCGTFLTPLKASRFCVGFSSTNVLIIVILSGSGNASWDALSPQPNPLCQGLRLTFGGLEHDVGHRFHVRHGYFAATQSANEANNRRSGRAAAVHGGPNFRPHYPTQVRRTEREVAIDYADGLETP